MPPASCFSATTVVQEFTKGAISMKDLQVGDKIMSGNSWKDGKRDYETVYAFAHRDENAKTDFLQIETEISSSFSATTSAPRAPLEATSDHLIYLNGKKHPVPAGSLKVGDTLQGTHSTGWAKVVVKSIGTVQKTGIYAPLTPSGTLVVDGVKASAYISLQTKANEYVELQGGITAMSQHDFIHMGFSPFRMACRMKLLLVGNNAHSSSSNNAPSGEISGVGDGMPRFVSYGIQAAHYVDTLHLHLSFQVILLAACLLVMGFFMAVEFVFFGGLPPLFTAMIAVTVTVSLVVLQVYKINVGLLGATKKVKTV